MLDCVGRKKLEREKKKKKKKKRTNDLSYGLICSKKVRGRMGMACIVRDYV